MISIRILTLSLLLVPGALSNVLELTNNKVYKIKNMGDPRLYLTAIGVKKANAESDVVTDYYRDAATQKWRLVTVDPKLSLIELQPTSDETCKLGMGSDKIKVSQVESHWYNSIGFGKAIHQWRVIPVQGGYVELLNYDTTKCLQNLSVGQRVGVGNCDNTVSKQWLLEKI